MKLDIVGMVSGLPVLLLILLVLCSFQATAAHGADRPTVRVTTGVVQINGWQGDLVKHNPNLSRWHWNPVYVYKQGLVGGGRKNTNAAGERSRASAPPPMLPEGSRYVKPVHVPFNPKALAEVEAKTQAKGLLIPNRSNEIVKGKLLPVVKESQTALAPPAQSAVKQAEYSTYDTTQIRSNASVHGELKEKKVAAKASPVSSDLTPGAKEKKLEELKASPKSLAKAHKL